MTRIAVAMALWLAFAFVVWNVVFDRYVSVAAVEFTRQQIVGHQRGDAVTSIHAGFSPHVRHAAWKASLWVSPVLVGGAVAVYFTARRSR
jgi:hypothetical protein